MVEVDPLLDGLNSQQREAVSAPLGPTLVLAGPGSGKTRVLTHRIAYLIEQYGASPSQILAVTFTNKAAREMRHRLETMLGNTVENMTIGTFHSVCVKILRTQAERFGVERGFTIYDRDDQVALMKAVLKQLNADDKKYRPQSVLAAISQAKSEMKTADTYQPPTYWHEIVARAFEEYQKFLRANNALDFDDLLLETVRGLEENEGILRRYRARYRHVLVDEFQDTNLPQYELIRLLAWPDTDLFVVGDEDQSIYGWRGADYRNLERLRQTFPSIRTILLEKNYRSTQTILDAAKAVIARNSRRVPKDLSSAKEKGEPVRLLEAYSTEEEAEYVVSEIERLISTGEYRLSNFAIMYRMNSQSRALEEAFMRHQLPYKLVGGTRFYQRSEIKDILSYLRIVATPTDWVSFERIVNVPSRSLGAVSLGHLRDAGGRMGLGPYDTLLQLRDSESVAPDLTARARNAFLGFLDIWEALIELSKTGTVADVMDGILSLFGYWSYLVSMGPEGEERQENVQELRAVAAEHFPEPGRESLAQFLDEVALVADVDELEEEVEAPVLMTLHTAKGLEFPVVFIVGVQEGVLPHVRSIDEPEQLEEERRLFYVGITRAMEHLYVLCSLTGRYYGQDGRNEPSRFIKDIPQQEPSSKVARTAASGSVRTRERVEAERQLAQPVANEVAKYRLGQTVVHPKFGRGVVVEYKPMKNDAEVSVAFLHKSVGIKRLLVSLAPLTLES